MRRRTIDIKYKVILSGSNCSFLGSGSYKKGETVTVICLPASGYLFQQWSDGETNASRTFIVNSNISLTAFVVKSYTVKLSGTNCTLQGAGTYPVGTLVTIKCIPDTYYKFVKWTSNNINYTNSSLTITVNDNVKFTATVLDKRKTIDGVLYYNERCLGAVSTSLSGSILILSQVDGYNITSIDSGAFKDCTSISSVSIPDTVINIGGWAFNGCTGLTTATIGNSVETFSWGAFEGCTSLASIIIPNSTTSIGTDSFNGCSSLTQVTIGSSVTSIGCAAFYGCSNLTSITIPNSVTSIESEAFYECRGINDITMGNSVKQIKYNTFKGCTRILSIILSNSIVNIKEYAFYGCSSLTSVTIPATLVSISLSAFGSTGLTDVYYKGTLTQWNHVSKDSNWDGGNNPTIHYNS